MNIYQIGIGEIRLPVDKGGGADNFIFCIAKYLSAQGCSVTLVDRKHLPDDSEEEHVDGLRIARLKARRFEFNLLRKLTFSNPFVSILISGMNQAIFAYKVRSFLSSRVRDGDIVHVHSSPTLLPLVLLNRNLKDKIFYTSHTPRRLLDHPKRSDRLALSLENRLLGRVRRVIVLNDLVREKLSREAGLRQEDIEVMPVGIDPLDFRPDLDDGDILDRYEVAGKTSILFIGRIREEKGVEYLIRAMNILVNRWEYKHLMLLLVGPVEDFEFKGDVRTPYLRKVFGLVEEYQLAQHIRLTGSLPSEDLKGLLAACHVFVLPSLTEATPTAVLEAMSCAKPVVASRVGGVPEQVEDGKSGFLVDPRDEEGLADRIRHLIDNPTLAAEMGARGRELVKAGFNWSKITERLLQIYRVNRDDGSIW